jgi:hypothetical protein
VESWDGGQIALVAHQHSVGLPVVLGQPCPLGEGEEAAELEAHLQRGASVEVVGGHLYGNLSGGQIKLMIKIRLKFRKDNWLKKQMCGTCQTFVKTFIQKREKQQVKNL